jgi:hypothetical protein
MSLWGFNVFSYLYCQFGTLNSDILNITYVVKTLLKCVCVHMHAHTRALFPTSGTKCITLDKLFQQAVKYVCIYVHMYVCMYVSV